MLQWSGLLIYRTLWLYKEGIYKCHFKTSSWRPGFTKFWLQRHLGWPSWDKFRTNWWYFQAMINCSWNNHPSYILAHAGGNDIGLIRARAIKKFTMKTMSNLNNRKMGNFRVVQFSRYFPVSPEPRKLKSTKYFPRLTNSLFTFLQNNNCVFICFPY